MGLCELEKEIEGTNSNENSTTKTNIATYSDKTLCVPSTTIAKKKIYRKLVRETSTAARQILVKEH